MLEVDEALAFQPCHHEDKCFKVYVGNKESVSNRICSKQQDGSLWNASNIIVNQLLQCFKLRFAHKSLELNLFSCLKMF